MSERNYWKLAWGLVLLLVFLWGGLAVWEWVWQGRMAFAWLAQPAPAEKCPPGRSPCSRAEALEQLLAPR